MRFSLLLRVLAVFFLCVAAFGCSRKEAGEAATVAKVGARTITLGQLETKFRAAPPKFKPREEGLEGLRAFLDTMIQKELLAQASEDSIGGLNDKQKRRLDRRTDNIIYEIIDEREVRPDMKVSDAEVEAFYQSRRIGYRPRHIVVKSLGEANDVMRLLNEGGVFEALAMQMSIDRRTYRNGGDMGFVSIGDTPPEFENALKGMKVGETIGPIKTSMGYHIIRLEDKREVELPPMDDKLKESLRMMVLSRRAKEIKDAFLEKVKKEVHIKYHPEAVRLLDRRFTALWADKKFLEDPASIGSPGVDASGWFPSFTDEDRDLALLSIADSTITLGQWIDKMLYAPAIVWPKGGGDEWIRSHLDDTYYKDMVIAYGESKGMRKDPEVRRRRTLAREEMLVNTFYFTRIDTVGRPTDDEVWDYYNENLPHYSLPEDLVQATIFHFNDEKAAAEAMERWKSGEDRDLIYKDYQEDGVLTEWEPSGKYFRSNTETELFDACWSREAGDIFGPLEMFGDYLVIRMEGKTPEGPIPYKYAKDRVRQDMWEGRKEDRLQGIITDLKTKYPVEVNEKVLASSELAKVKKNGKA